MALLVCRGCGTRFSIGAPWCPQCTSTDAYIEGEEPMPHSNRGGVSDKTMPQPEPEAPEAPEAEAEDVEPGGAADDVTAPVRPPLNASTGEWLAYVRNVLGVTVDDPEDVTRTRLIELADQAEAEAAEDTE